MNAHRNLWICLFCIVSQVTIGHVTGDEKNPAPWRALPLIQDGNVAPGWAHLGWGSFVVEQGALRTECDERGLGLLLYTPETFGNCQIRVEYRSQNPKSNAGVFVRIDPGILERVKQPTSPVRRAKDGKLSDESLRVLIAASEQEQGPWYAVHHGFEVQICDDADTRHRTGSIYSLAAATPFPKNQDDPWNTMIITLDGEVIRVEINGHAVSEFDSRSIDVGAERQWHEPKRKPVRPVCGHIGLQNHDPGDVVFFRDVSVRPLATLTNR